MELNNLQTVFAFDSDGNLKAFVNGATFQGIQSLEFGQSYIFVSNASAIPYANCADSNIRMDITGISVNTNDPLLSLKVQSDGLARLDEHSVDLTVEFRLTEIYENYSDIHYSFNENFEYNDGEDGITTGVSNYGIATHATPVNIKVPLTNFFAQSDSANLGQTLSAGDDAFAIAVIYYRDSDVLGKVYRKEIIFDFHADPCPVYSGANATNGECDNGYIAQLGDDGCIAECVQIINGTTSTTTSTLAPCTGIYASQYFDVVCAPAPPGLKHGINKVVYSTVPGEEHCIQTIKCVYIEDPNHSCPSPDMTILMSDGSEKRAGDLVVGDTISTQHEESMEEGNYKISYVATKLADRLKITFADGLDFICSKTHKFYHKGQWIEASQLNEEEIIQGRTINSIEENGVGQIVHMAVEDAHTYICEGFLSHNKSYCWEKLNPPDNCPDGPTTTTSTSAPLPTSTTTTEPPTTTTTTTTTNTTTTTTTTTRFPVDCTCPPALGTGSLNPNSQANTTCFNSFPIYSMYTCPESSELLAVGCQSYVYELKDPVPDGCEDAKPCNPDERGLPVCKPGETLVRSSSTECEFECVPTSNLSPVDPINYDISCREIDYDGDDSKLPCAVGMYSDASRGDVWIDIISDDCPQNLFPSPCKRKCSCDGNGTYPEYFCQGDADCYEEYCVGVNGENHCTGSELYRIACGNHQVFTSAETCVDGVLYTDGSLCQSIGPCDAKPPVFFPLQEE